MSASRSPALAIAFVLSLAVAAPASALVGPTEGAGAFAPHTVMVLSGGKGRTGFCSGVVIATDTILTAAHCVGAPAATMAHFRDANDAPVLIPVARVETHPAYRANAVAARAKSVDLALVRTATPLPDRFSAATIAAAPAEAGATLTIAGYGLSDERAASSGGVLRSARMVLRAPLSQVLLWLDNEHGAGACTGDSGGPVFEGDALVGVIAYAQGEPGRKCGKLTQAVRVAPERAWIDSVLARWR